MIAKVVVIPTNIRSWPWRHAPLANLNTGTYLKKKQKPNIIQSTDYYKAAVLILNISSDVQAMTI